MFPGHGREETDVRSVRQAELMPLPPSFCSIQVLNGLDEAHPRGTLHSLSPQFKCYSHLETPSAAHAEVRCHLQSGPSVTQSASHIQLTSIDALLLSLSPLKVLPEATTPGRSLGRKDGKSSPRSLALMSPELGPPPKHAQTDGRSHAAAPWARTIMGTLNSLLV